MRNPKNQQEELLFELLDNSRLSRKEIMAHTGILNPPAVVCILRKKGVPIKMRMIKHSNKWGRMVEYGEYFLLEKDKEKAQEFFNNLLKK
jgi:hypothetical protein